MPTELDSKDYSVLEVSIISIYERSKSEMFQEFLSKQPYIGRPSSYLLVNLVSKLNFVEDTVFLHFIDALPSTIHPILAAQASLSLKQLGTFTNDLVPLSIPSPQPGVNCAPVVASPATRC